MKKRIKEIFEQLIEVHHTQEELELLSELMTLVLRLTFKEEE